MGEKNYKMRDPSNTNADMDEFDAMVAADKKRTEASIDGSEPPTEITVATKKNPKPSDIYYAVTFQGKVIGAGFPHGPRRSHKTSIFA